jgi:hypothetical protein
MATFFKKKNGVYKSGDPKTAEATSDDNKRTYKPKTGKYDNNLGVKTAQEQAKAQDTGDNLYLPKNLSNDNKMKGYSGGGINTDKVPSLKQKQRKLSKQKYDKLYPEKN